MVKPKKTTAAKKRTVFELVGESRPPFKRGENPLDDILLDEERELSREAKRIRLEEIVIRKRREIEKMRKGVVDDGPLPSNADFLNMAKALAELSPEEAQRVRSSYTFFKMAERSGGGGAAGMNLLLPLIGYARDNPGASQNQMVQYLGLMNKQMVTGMELMKAANPGKQDNPLEFIKLIKDLVVEGVRDPLMRAFKESQPQPGLLDQIFTNPDLWSRFKDIGIFGGSNTATSKFDLEIEKLRGERQMQMHTLTLQQRQADLKRQNEDRKFEMMLSIFGPIAAAFAGPASERMRGLGEQAAAHNPISNKPAPPVEVVPRERSIQMKCPCGYEAEIPLTDPAPEKFDCPNCGQVLMYNQFETLNGGNNR